MILACHGAAIGKAAVAKLMVAMAKCVVALTKIAIVVGASGGDFSRVPHDLTAALALVRSLVH